MIERRPDGSVLAVRVVPGSSRAGLAGQIGDELRVRVCSPPVDGRANSEVCAVVASVLGVRRREVRVLSGALGRSKRLIVDLPAEELQARLMAQIGPDRPCGR